MSFSCENLENHPIPLEDIELATQNFSQENWISEVEFGETFRGELSERWKNCTATFKRFHVDRCQGKKEFLNELKGLNYLHTGLGADGIVIHGSITKSNILLDDNLKAKICGFDISALIPSNQPHQQVYRPNAPDCGYMDPIYLATGFLKAESDIYSFGVLLFDIMIRRLAFDGMTTYGNDDPRNMIKLVRRCGDHGLDNYNMKDRPTLDRIIKSIEEALEAASTITKRSRGYENILQVLIPFEEIKLATGNFSPESTVVANHLENSYRGQLSAACKNLTVTIKRYHFDISELNAWLNDQVEILFRFHHENINPCIGYCDEDNQLMLVFEHPINDLHGSARGLKCLRSGLWEENRVVHRHFRSEFILLDENMEAKISDIDFSILVFRNQPQAYDCPDPTSNYEDYVDPVYKESEIINVEVDVYSFRVVMFEILSGLMAYDRASYDDEDTDAADDDDYLKKHNLIKRVHHYYDDGLDNLIDPSIRDQIDSRSLHTYIETAYKCLSFNIKERPSMNRIKRIEEALYIQNHRAAASTSTKRSRHYQKLEDLLIPLTEISLATGDFSKDSRIGDGGFGVVYQGRRLSDRWQNHEAAIKRLDKTGHQGKREFLNELRLISRFHHQNIISFIGYCDEGDEMILVYEYASNGSLDHHLQDRNKRHQLTWAHRLKICLGAARGLDYLHSGLGEDSRVIHRDVKSSNILLDENMEAKICDFGLSKSDSAISQQHTKL
ncbi:protein kinase, ATP binding site-containing protein [Tanacetum coccineum]